MDNSNNRGREHFDALFASSDDPWGFKARWYEARKRMVTLACLPAARYAYGYEPGCANGELSAALAARCDKLLVSDGCARAVDLARKRLAPLGHVRVEQAWLPGEWPSGNFDLIVISELGYFLDASSLDSLADKTLSSLQPGGTVVACHWRRPIRSCELDGEAVHRRLGERLELASISQVMEVDFILAVWSDDSRSVAEREGFDW